MGNVQRPSHMGCGAVFRTPYNVAALPAKRDRSVKQADTFVRILRADPSDPFVWPSTALGS